MTLRRRLSKLEDRERKTEMTTVKLFWSEEVEPCLLHSNCAIEHASGTHHSGIIHLTFRGDSP